MNTYLHEEGEKIILENIGHLISQCHKIYPYEDPEDNIVEIFKEEKGKKIQQGKKVRVGIERYASISA